MGAKCPDGSEGMGDREGPIPSGGEALLNGFFLQFSSAWEGLTGAAGRTICADDRFDGGEGSGAGLGALGRCGVHKDVIPRGSCNVGGPFGGRERCGSPEGALL
jgi:hypothetical protein